MKKIFSIILRTSVSIALLFFLFSKIDLRSTLSTMFGADASWLASAFLVFVITYVILFYRWFMLLKVQGVGLSVRRVLVSFAGGIFFSLFLPSTIGGDVARSIDLGMYIKRRSVVIASVLLDRLSGFVGLVLVAIVSLIIGVRIIDETSVYLMVLVMSLALAAISVVMFNKKIYEKISRSSHKKGSLKDKLKKLHLEVYYFRSKGRALFINLLYSVTCQITSAIAAYYILRALGANISFLYLLVLNPIIIVVSMLPISIGGLGLRDASSVYFLTQVGVSKNAALAFSLLNFAFMVILGILGGIIYASTLHYRRLQPDKTKRVS